MARQTNLKLVGRFGNLRFYKRYDDYYVKSIPKNIKQSKATKACSGSFGKSNTLARILRQLLLPVLADKNIMDKRNKLHLPLYQWLLTDSLKNTSPQNDAPLITGYEFNSKSAFLQRFKKPLSIERLTGGNLGLIIPSLNPVKDIIAPTGTQSVQLFIASGSCNPGKNTTVAGYSTSIIYTYSDTIVPEQNILLPIAAVVSNLTVTSAALRYTAKRKNGEMVTMERRWMPAAIIGAMYN